MATADAIVCATARHASELLTCDALFQNLPGVVFFRKSI
ncbi:MAG: hypothetical protein RET84_23780 [Pseudomonadota bacterium]|nr:hypothetical protein [Pseudomonadota bacterium]